MLNPNNEKYVDKTIRYKLQYVIYGFTTTVIANLISLANVEPREKSHFQLPPLFLWSYPMKITHAMYYKCRDLHQQRTENQICTSLHLQWDQFCKSLNSNRKKVLLFCLGIRNCIILWYLGFLTRWENLHHENWRIDHVSWSSKTPWVVPPHYNLVSNLSMSLLVVWKKFNVIIF